MSEQLEELFRTIAEEATEYPGEAVITLKARLRNIRELCTGGVEQMHAILKVMTAEHAPELLEALRDLYGVIDAHRQNYLTGQGRNNLKVELFNAEQAIQKATGATPGKARA